MKTLVQFIKESYSDNRKVVECKEFVDFLYKFFTGDMYKKIYGGESDNDVYYFAPDKFKSYKDVLDILIPEADYDEFAPPESEIENAMYLAYKGDDGDDNFYHTTKLVIDDDIDDDILCFRVYIKNERNGDSADKMFKIAHNIQFAKNKNGVKQIKSYFKKFYDKLKAYKA